LLYTIFSSQISYMEENEIKRHFQGQNEAMSERGFNKIKWNEKKMKRYGLTSKTYKGRQIVFEDDVEKMLTKEYDEIIAPNIGIETFFAIIKRKYIGITRRELATFLKLQPKYQEGQRRVLKPMAKSIVSTRPFQRIQIDTINTSQWSKSFPHTLTCIDTFSKFLYVEPVTNMEATTVNAAMKRIISKMPKKMSIIQSDNGTEFASMLKSGNVYDKFYDDYKIVRSSPQNPAANGMIERVHGFIKKYVDFAQEKKQIAFSIQIQKVVDLFNDRPHSITRKRPNELNVVNLEPDIQKEVLEKIQKSANKVNPPAGTFPPLKVGDFVRLAILKKSPLDKLTHNWSQDVYRITHARRNETYRIAIPLVDGSMKPKKYIYQRDFLYKIPKESAEKQLKDEIDRDEEAKKEQFEREQQRRDAAVQRNLNRTPKVVKTSSTKYKIGDNLQFKKRFFQIHDPNIPLEKGLTDLKAEISAIRQGKYYVKFFSGEYKNYDGNQNNQYDFKDVEGKHVSKL